MCFLSREQLCYRGISCRHYVRPSVLLSVCLSVCYTRALYQNQTMHCGHFDTKRKDLQPLCFSDINSGWCMGRRPLSNLRSKRPTPFEKRRLWQISAYNLWTVRDSEKRSIMTNRKWTTGFLTSHRWSAYVTPKVHKGWLKKRFFCFFWNKSQLQSNKVCYKVSLCENLQRQSCCTTIPLSNGYRCWREK